MEEAEREQERLGRVDKQYKYRLDRRCYVAVLCLAGFSGIARNALGVSQSSGFTLHRTSQAMDST